MPATASPAASSQSKKYFLPLSNSRHAKRLMQEGRLMKFICLGYIEDGKFGAMSPEQQSAMVDECLSYDDELRRRGHFAGGEALDAPSAAATLRFNNGKVVVTDGPYAETKEQIGGILILEARDRQHAIEIMSKHPGVKAGPFEIRPAVDMTDMVRESEKRRSTHAK